MAVRSTPFNATDESTITYNNPEYAEITYYVAEEGVYRVIPSAPCVDIVKDWDLPEA